MNIKVIRTDGAESIALVDGKDAIRMIHELIGASCCDTVNLRDGRIMMVDDDGWETRLVEKKIEFNGSMVDAVELDPVRSKKPLNEKATKLYHAVCKPGTTHRIVGDVAIVLDEEFA